MAKNKIGLKFKGFEEMIADLEALNGDVKQAVEGSLRVAHDTVTPKLLADMRKHKRTGNTAQAIVKKSKVKWDGTTATIKVGFQLPEGLPSVFLMYGTPRVQKDQQLYNDVYGSAAIREIAKKQKKIFEWMIRKRMGGK